MKENYKIRMMIVLIAIALSLSSCRKYLDIKTNSTQNFIENAVDCQRLLDDYIYMNTNYPSDGQASCDDFYLGTNVYPAGLQQENMDVYTWQATAIHAAATSAWQTPYFTVYYANLVLDALGKDKVQKSADIATLNNLKGSALFFRAFALWNVAQLYAKPYGATAAQDPGIPARTSADLNDVFGRGTVKETYDRITQDLKDAIDLLSANTPVKPTRPYKAAAYAMLARVYLSMEDYSQAFSNADAALKIKSTLIDYSDPQQLDVNSSTPFTQFNNEVFFHALINSNQLLSPGNAGNPIARINQSLYDLYNNNDLRKAVLFKPNTITVQVIDPSQSSGLTTVTVKDGTYRFTGNYDPTTPALFNGLGVDEMFLTRAECYARAGDFNLAMKDLKTLLVNRFKKDGAGNTTYLDPVVTTADQALDIVLTERRKELVMRGQRWTDLRRLNKDTKFKKDLVRDLTTVNAVSTGTYPNQTITITYPVTSSWTLFANDIRYTLLIPQEVITKANMNQNPR